jgi:hypothetical protein
LPFHTNRALIWPFHHMGGKDNPPPSVIYIVHQQLCYYRVKTVSAKAVC